MENSRDTKIGAADRTAIITGLNYHEREADEAIDFVSNELVRWIQSAEKRLERESDPTRIKFQCGLQDSYRRIASSVSLIYEAFAYARASLIQCDNDYWLNVLEGQKLKAIVRNREDLAIELAIARHREEFWQYMYIKRVKAEAQRMGISL